MTNYSPGDIVLVEFSFTDGTGSKRRPALIISSDKYNKNRREVILAAITSNIERVLPGDTRIDDWEEAGLIYPSLATGIIRTIKARMINRKLGALTKQDFGKVQESLEKAISL